MGGTFPNVDEPNYPLRRRVPLPPSPVVTASLLSPRRPPNRPVRRSWVHFTLPTPRTLESVCGRVCAYILYMHTCARVRIHIHVCWHVSEYACTHARAVRSLTFVFCMRKCVRVSEGRFSVARRKKMYISSIYSHTPGNAISTTIYNLQDG